MNDQQSGIRVHTGFFFLAFLLYFFKTKLHVDNGPAMERPWGDTFFPLPPGRHAVRCYSPYLILSTMGDSTAVVDVPPGQVVDLKWSAPWLVFLQGKWTTLGVRPFDPSLLNLVPRPPGMPAGAVAPGMPVQPGQPAPVGGGQPANWYPDPSGRHELRYWDGGQWTHDVSDQGQGSSDPI